MFLGDLPEMNVVFPLDTLHTYEYQADQENLEEVVSTNVLFNTTSSPLENNVLNSNPILTDPDTVLPSISEINNKNIKLRTQNNSKKSNKRGDGISNTEDDNILNNVKIVSNNTFNQDINLQMEMNCLQSKVCLTPFNISESNLYESAEVLCSVCEMKFISVKSLWKHKCLKEMSNTVNHEQTQIRKVPLNYFGNKHKIFKCRANIFGNHFNLEDAFLFYKK